MRILLDTSIIIEYLRSKQKEDSQLYQLSSNGAKLCISLITHAELYSGKSAWEYKKAKKVLEATLSNIIILPVNKEISKLAGKTRAKYGTELIDAIIAATALKHDLPLSTLNHKHFSTIKGLKLF